MRCLTPVLALAAAWAGLATAQQYVGEVIPNSLPPVGNAEITYFKIPGTLDKNKTAAANLTLINYYSHGQDGNRIVESKIKRAVIIIHGLNRDPGTYQSNMQSALAQVTTPGINFDNVVIMAPYFTNGDDKGTGYPWNASAATSKSYTSALVWKGSQWSAGANNQYPTVSQNTSSYFVLDTLIRYFDDKTLFPNMNQIVVAGHSLGAQTVHRYAALGQRLGTTSSVIYWVANPNSYVYMDTVRPLPTTGCPTYDNYRDGYSNFSAYPMTYGQALVSQGRPAILANYNSKQVAYARGLLDTGDDSSGCEPLTTGINRNERFFNFIKAFPISCPDPAGRNCDTADLVNMGHDGGGMMAVPAGRARLFEDNFNGDGKRAYDFGYPRVQAGDDPYPDPALNSTSATFNNNTYAGNMTYAGCFTDNSNSRSFPIQISDNSSTTIEFCTAACASQGYSVAGMEYSSQCWCSNAMTYQAQRVIEGSCNMGCAGNSTEMCGGISRLSVFSNGTPKILPPPSMPETINGSWYSQGCLTEASDGSRALAGPASAGNFMTLEYCASFCKGSKYFGVEYGAECYCGSSISPLANLTNTGECSMTCANNSLEYCGASYRLTLYVDTTYTAPTTTSSSPGSAPTGSGVPVADCPASNNTIVAANGKNFIVECGTDHVGQDLASATVSSFRACIDLCSSTAQCVDASFLGSACYLKSGVGDQVSSPNVWGARLVASTSTSTSTTSTISATTSATPVTCPASNGTVYTGVTGQRWLVECDVDHQGGDLNVLQVATFQGCIDACDKTASCVDVSQSGTTCYLKSVLGPAGNAAGIWGAKLLPPGSTSSSTASTTSTTTSSASATPTTLTCPASNGTTYLSAGRAFLIECDTDHYGGDISFATVANFQGCVDLCSSTPQCVDVSLSGSTACYLKGSLGAPANAPGIWGAKFVTLQATTSTSSTSSVVTSTSSTATSSTATTNATAAPTPISCPGSNNTIFTAPSGKTFLIECFVDRAGGDFASTTVDNFTQCIGACDATAGCLDAVLLGAGCYMKNVVGAGNSNPNVWGAKLNVGGLITTSSTTSPTLTTLSTSTSTSLILTTTSSTSTALSTTSTPLVTPTTTSSNPTTTTSSTTSTMTSTSSSTSTIPTTTSTSPTTSTLTTPTTTSTSSTTSTTSSTTPVMTTSSSTTTTSTSSTSSTTASSSLPSGISYSGCFIDNAGSRTLPYNNGTSNTQTPAQCALACRGLGYRYSGSEYASECWCGNLVPTTKASADSECSMPCKGDAAQKCGAADRLSVYVDSSWVQTLFARPSYKSWNLMACYSDSTGSRTLQNSVSLAAHGGAANASIANCMSACQTLGYVYCGAEYYQECYASNTAPATSLVAAGQDPISAGCSFACKGNSTEVCGGAGKILVYTNNGTST
ncbi:hypothetical protein LTR95_008475 [Oleoguttula sp. CCFEE 5521]